MTKHLLLEIGMEEIPARFVRSAMQQLADKVGDWLTEARLAHGELKAYATPRRIAVIVSDVAEQQEDLDVEAKGPSRKIAVDDAGQWTKAALGFARGQGVAPEQLFFRELDGTEYVYARKKVVGKRTVDTLSEALSKIVTSLSFPKNMRWGAYELRYVRPIRWIVALFGEEVVPFDVAGVRSDRQSHGHRFLGKNVSIPEPSAYEATLRSEFVEVDIDKRKASILKQINDLAESKGWVIDIDQGLLEEVLFIVEYPTVLYGTFEDEFLDIPQDVLITSMREHQRYFPVKNKEGKLLPYFVTVRNGDDTSLDVVARGNEKVLRARLSDARFFYYEDQKLAIDDALAKLERIVFQDELGTVGDKVRRIRALSGKLAEQFSVDPETRLKVDRSAEICKFDLVTQMVYEFPELQGVMGEDYARKAGEDADVSRAIFEHYQPRFAGDAVPASLIGAILSLADKLDTIAGCFSIGIVPTGSQDPYALRRQASGIVQIILEHDLPISLGELFELALTQVQDRIGLKRDKDEILHDLHEFFALRVKNVLSETARYDVVDAIMAAGIGRLQSAVRKAAALQDSVRAETMKANVEAYNRVDNLAAKATKSGTDASLFTESVERELYDTWQNVRVRFIGLLESEKEHEALQALEELREPITRFFDTVMVMTDDAAVRNNRLGLLAAMAADFKRFADFQKLVWS